jgi:hypothetical protein
MEAEGRGAVRVCGEVMRFAALRRVPRLLVTRARFF